MYKRIYELAQISILLSAMANQSVLADTVVEVTRTTEVGSPAPVIVTPAVTTRETVIETTRSAPSTSTEIITDPPVVRVDYQRRLDLLKEQMDNAISKGWVSTIDSSILQNDFAGLVSSLTVARAHDFPTDEAQSLEKQFNSFNIELSDKMAAGKH